MFERIYPFLEILAIIYCLHCIYGKRMQIDLATVLLIISDLFLFEFINIYSMPRVWSLLMYWFIALYILIEFPFGLRQMILSNVFYIVLIALLQLLVSLAVLVIQLEFLQSEILMCLINLSTILLLFWLRKIVNNFYNLLLESNIFTSFIGIFYFLLIFWRILSYKAEMNITVEGFLYILTFGLLLVVTIYFWQKEREKSYQKEMDLKTHEIYGESFKDLIDVIRKRQHEFHNHIQAMMCMHYTIHTYEELVYEQEKYCSMVIENNKFYKLLTNTWPVVAGFLYGKFQEADEKKIEVIYNVQVTKRNECLPEFILIEIVGILLDNAIEAVTDTANPTIRVYLIEDSRLEIIISNPIESIQKQNLAVLFRKGYSSKQGHAGLGLNKLLEYQVQYGFKKEVLIEDYDDREWLTIKLLI